MSEPEQATAPCRKPKRSATSPTQRTLAECRKRGWTAQVVERWNAHARVRVDLFGVIDLVALTPAGSEVVTAGGEEFVMGHNGDIVGVQACAGASHSARRAKILAEPRARQWVEAGGRLELWSWALQGARGKRKTWTLRVEVFTEESWRTHLQSDCI